MAKIRVLHVLGGLSQGGVENLIMNIYRTIDKDKIQFDFLVNRDGFFDDEVKKSGGRIYRIPALQTVGQIRYKNNLRQFLEEHKEEYRLIHSHLNQVSGLILEVAKKAGVPVRIAHAHNNAYAYGILKKIYKDYLGSKINKNATCLLACSDEAANFMFKKDALKAIIINNGIPVDKFVFNNKKRTQFRNKHGLGMDDFVVGNVGRFEKQKNHLFLVDVFCKIYKKKSSSRLVLLGAGSLKEKVKEECRRRGVGDRVLFLESTENTDFLYCGIDVFLFPSLFEGLGISLVEAQTSGLYCYASAGVIPAEAKISYKAKFVPLSKTGDEWADVILNDYDLIRNNKRVRIENNSYDINDTVKALMDVYLKLLEGVKVA